MTTNFSKISLITLTFSHQTQPFIGNPHGRYVTQTVHVWQTINTHRKQARLVAYTGQMSNNKTPPFFPSYLKPLCISCERRLFRSCILLLLFFCSQWSTVMDL